VVYSVLTGRTRAPARGLIVQNAIHSTIDPFPVSLERVRSLRSAYNAATARASPQTEPNHGVGNANKAVKVPFKHGTGHA
jgi:hypothetical protein